MKKLITLLCMTVLFLVPVFALAEGEDFTLARDAVIPGMDCSWAHGYEPAVKGDVMTVHLPIASDATEDDISAVLIPAEGMPSPFTGAGLAGEFIREDDGLWHVTLKVKLARNRVNGDYAATLRITGESGTADIPLILSVRDGRMPAGELRPVLSDVTADLRVGEMGTLTAVVTNPNLYAALTDVAVTVADAADDILPVGSSRVPLGDWLPGESRTVEIPLQVRADAAVTLHTLDLTLSYTALEGTGNWQESFVLPVTQDIRMEVGGAEMATTAVQGAVAHVALPVMNLGRADIVNTMVQLTLPGVADRQTVLVGTVTPGGTGRAELTFVPGPDVLGRVEGTLHVSCEDAWGNTAEREIPVSLTVEEPAEDILAAVPDAEPAPGWLPWALGGCCAVLAALLILQGTLLRRKIHQMEEERL